jgi:HlyD family secretion protein
MAALSRGSSTRRHRRIRRGVSWISLLVGLTVTLGLMFLAWQMMPGSTSAGEGPIPYQVDPGVFVHEVTERGEVESSNNIEVRCEVKSKTSQGVVIKKLIAEGTEVEQGDLLCEFDDTALQDELIAQQITCNMSRAAVTTAEFMLTNAETALMEYQEGTFKQEAELIESEIALAEENLRRAAQYLTFSKKLATKGYITPLQLKADQFAVTKAENELKAALTKLDVLKKFTKKKMIDQLTSDVETARVKLDSEQKSHELDERKRAWIEEQIANCLVYAPAAGQVVHANQSDRRGQDVALIEEGAVIRERQAIIRLPDPAKMQVKAKINESRIDLVRAGMRATVRLDAFPETALKGVVTKVDDYPMAGNWFSSNVKEYATIIRIEDPPPGMRAGMTAEVKIHVERLDNILQVPVTAVIERNGTHYCLWRDANGGIKAREVVIGSSNDKFVVIRDGIKAGEQVLVNPRSHLDLVDLPAVAVTQVASADNFVADPTAQAAATRPAGQTGGEGTVAGGPGAGGRVADGSGGGPAGGGRPAGGPGAGGPGAGAPSPAAIAKMFISQADKDGDGKLSEEELPEDRRSTFSEGDTNGDGFLDEGELAAAMAKVMRQMQQAGGGPGGAAGGVGGK